MMISPSEVQAKKSGGQYWVRGSFSIIALLNNPRAIRSIGTGGACMVADLNHLNIPARTPLGTVEKPVSPPVGLPYRGYCQTSSQCNGSLPAGWAGYCIENACWTRPGGGEYCTRSTPDNGGQPWELGVDHPVPLNGASPAPSEPPYIDVSAIYKILEQRSKMHGFRQRWINWRIHACLNGIDAKGGDSRGCGLGPPASHVYEDGYVKSLPL
jgi:hypothetical protein